MITMRQIAELAGVSRGTVDRVLNNRPGVNAETFQKVKSIAEKMGYEPNVAGQMLAARKKKLKIGYIVCDTPIGLFFSDVYKAAKKKASELLTYGVTVKFYLLKELTDEYTSQIIQQIEKDELDGIAVSPIRIPALIDYIHVLEEKGIPMVFFNLDMPEVKRLSYVGCDYYVSGKVAAGLIGLVTKGKGKVALANIFNGQSPSFSERMKGFLDELEASYPCIEIVNRNDGYLFQQGNYTSIIKMIEEHPDLDAFYVINPGDYKICEEIARHDVGKRIRIITNDVMKEQKNLMEEGIISATIGQQPELQGELPLQILYEYLGLAIQPQEKYLTELSIYIKQNIATDF